MVIGRGLFRTFGLTCPVCGHILDAATIVAGPPGDVEGPKGGDWTICAGCIAPLAYSSDVRVLRELTADELVEFRADEGLVSVQRQLRRRQMGIE